MDAAAVTEEEELDDEDEVDDDDDDDDDDISKDLSMDCASLTILSTVTSVVWRSFR